MPATSYVLAGEDEAESAHDGDATGAEEASPLIVAEAPMRIETLTVGNAVLRLDLADLPALMFRNRSNGRLNVVFRRSDGNIGWIDPADGATDQQSGKE